MSKLPLVNLLQSGARTLDAAPGLGLESVRDDEALRAAVVEGVTLVVGRESVVVERVVGVGHVPDVLEDVALKGAAPEVVVDRVEVLNAAEERAFSVSPRQCRLRVLPRTVHRR